jgi:hypothetical protein
MDIDVVLTIESVKRLLREFTPVRIHLTEKDEDSRWVELDTPSDISLVPGRGIRIVTSGRVRYALAGLSVPASIRQLAVVLEPRVVTAGAQRRLDFRLQIDDADLELVPGVIDRAIVHKLNDALTPQATHMSWNFGRDLAKAVHLPERLEPLDQLLIQAEGGEVMVTSSELRIRLHLAVALSRTKPLPQDD